MKAGGKGTAQGWWMWTEENTQVKKCALEHRSGQHSHSHITCFLSPKPPEQLISAHALFSAISPAAVN